MKLYITALNWEDLSNKFFINKFYRYIDIDNLIKISGLKLSREVHKFVLNQEILHTLEKYFKYSYLGCNGIIYKNSNVQIETISALKELEQITEIICLDRWENPLLERIYDECDLVIRV